MKTIILAIFLFSCQLTSTAIAKGAERPFGELLHMLGARYYQALDLGETFDHQVQDRVLGALDPSGLIIPKNKSKNCIRVDINQRLKKQLKCIDSYINLTKKSLLAKAKLLEDEELRVDDKYLDTRIKYHKKIDMAYWKENLKNSIVEEVRLLDGMTENHKFNLLANAVLFELDDESVFFPIDEVEENNTSIFFGGLKVYRDERGKGTINPQIFGVKIENAFVYDFSGFQLINSQYFSDGKFKNEVSFLDLKGKVVQKMVSGKAIDYSSSDSFKIFDVNEIRVGYLPVKKLYVDFVKYSSGDPAYRSISNDVKKILKNEELNEFVIDLRFCSGGSFGEILDLIGIFGGELEVATVKNIRKEKTWKSKDGRSTNLSPILLIGSETASGAEIFANAVKHYGIGSLVGNVTDGMVSLREAFTIDGYGTSIIRTGTITGPEGIQIENRGISPDIYYDFKSSDWVVNDIEINEIISEVSKHNK